MKKAHSLAVLACWLVLSWAGPAGAGPVLDGILKRGEVVVGITGEQPPLNATTKDGEIIGFDADLARAVAVNMGLKVRFERMPFSRLLGALQEGKVDMVVSAVTMTPERNTRVAFVGPYLVSGKGLLLRLGTVEALKKEGIDSAKFRVAVLKGSTSQAIVEKAAPKAAHVPVTSYDEAIELLSRDQVEIVVADYPFCAYVADRYPEKGFVVGEAKLSYEPLGIAVQEDALWINALDNFLKVLVGTGEIGNLQDRWFKNRGWIKRLP